MIEIKDEPNILTLEEMLSLQRVRKDRFEKAFANSARVLVELEAIQGSENEDELWQAWAASHPGDISVTGVWVGGIRKARV